MLLRAPPAASCRAAAAAAPRGRAAAPLRACAPPRPHARRGRALTLASLGASGGDESRGARRQRGPSPPRVAGTAEPSPAPGAPPTMTGGAVAVEHAINKALVDSVVRAVTRRSKHTHDDTLFAFCARCVAHAARNGLQVFLVDSFYGDKPYARFYALETVARVPYFGARAQRGARFVLRLWLAPPLLALL
jgi:hypothetical protein